VHAGPCRRVQARYGIAVNSLWPRTAIATAALQMIPGVDLTCAAARDPGRRGLFHPHHFYIDDTLLAAHGITDLQKYAVKPGTREFIPDFFVD
jgi:citronellol/citronellal dehydrogenase